jgi:peptidoglycan/xylan/chitin deacetylase (PgdA/CDA1 family)
MRHLRESGHTPVDIGRVADWLEGRATLPPNAVCVTFDDGTDCLRDVALPILSDFGIPATAYVVSELLGRRNDWLQAEGWSERRLLDAADLRALSAAGISIGSHSCTHADLSRSDAATVRREVSDSRVRLEDTLGSRVEHFAYPYGRVGRLAYDALGEAGYRTACCVADGFVRRGDDPRLLSRVEVYHWDDIERFERKLRWGAADPRFNPQSMRRLARRALQRTGLLRGRLPA